MRPTEKAALFYATKATHVISLAFERTGQLLAGTEGPGRLFRVDAAGKAFLLLDSTFQEVRAIRMDPQGNIYLAALSGRTSSSSQPAATPAADTTPSAAREPGTDRHDRSDGDCRRRYRRRVGRHDGSAGTRRSAWRSRRHLSNPTRWTLGHHVGIGRGLAVRPDARSEWAALLWEPAVTANSTAWRAIRSTATLLMQASAQQVTGFARDAKGNMYYATSNPGKIFKLSSQRAAEGTYTSLVRDAQTVADWGTLSWRCVGAGRWAHRRIHAIR